MNVDVQRGKKRVRNVLFRLRLNSTHPPRTGTPPRRNQRVNKYRSEEQRVASVLETHRCLSQKKKIRYNNLKSHPLDLNAPHLEQTGRPPPPSCPSTAIPFLVLVNERDIWRGALMNNAVTCHCIVCRAAPAVLRQHCWGHIIKVKAEHSYFLYLRNVTGQVVPGLLYPPPPPHQPPAPTTSTPPSSLNR